MVGSARFDKDLGNSYYFVRLMMGGNDVLGLSLGRFLLSYCGVCY